MAVDINGKTKNTDNTHPIPALILLNDGFLFEKGITQDEEFNPLQKGMFEIIGLIVWIWVR